MAIIRNENWKPIEIVNRWTREDILDRMDEKNIEHPEDLVDEVMESIDRGFDAEVGINWTVIDTHIDMTCRVSS